MNAWSVLIFCPFLMGFRKIIWIWVLSKWAFLYFCSTSSVVGSDSFLEVLRKDLPFEKIICLGELIAERCGGLIFGPGWVRGWLGGADDKEFNAEMVVFVVALIGGTTKRADCYKENIII